MPPRCACRGMSVGHSDPTLSGVVPDADCCAQRFEVLVVLIGVGAGEVGQRPVEHLARSQIGANGDRIARPSVGTGQGPGTHAGVDAEQVRGPWFPRRPTPSSPTAGACRSPGSPSGLDPLPPQEDVAGGLHELLALDHPLAVVGMVALAQNGSSTEASASFTWSSSGSQARGRRTGQPSTAFRRCPRPTTLRADRQSDTRQR